jgi:hypothetical protein
MLFDLFQIVRGQIAFQQVELRGAHARALAAADELHAFLAAGRPHVELAGERFDG